MPREDLTGRQFGDWKVIAPADNYKWLCECQCPLHTRREVLASSLKRNISQSCGNRKYHPASKVDTRQKSTPEELLVRHWSPEAKQNRANKVETYAIGNEFGDWKITEKIDVRYYKCKCIQCGFERVLTTSGIWNAKKNGFKCNHIGHEVLKGKYFGKLEVLEEIGYKTCICKCHNCGKIVEVLRNNLRLGHYISCGCMKYESKFSKEEFESAIISYKLEHNGARPQPSEIADRLGLAMSATYKSIDKYNLRDEFEIYCSRAEKEIALLFEDIENVKRRDRSILPNYELDIYLPDYKLAIEYNGNFWHSELRKDNKNYHQQKTVEAIKHGIRLIHIFEYEWENNNDKIVAFLSDLVQEKEVYHGRNLKILEISLDRLNRFYNDNHLQGGIQGSKVNIALVDKANNVIAAMSLGKPRFNNNYEWEILRYCVKLGTAVSGAIERLYKYFENKYKPTSVITYADASKYTGQVYEKIGFKYTGITSPNYMWVNSSSESIPRYKTQKHKLLEQGLGTEDQTEVEIMRSLNYFRVYDCGNFRFERQYS